MNYIIFDLEWNQPEDGRKKEQRELLFEIIEIGAVKLNSRKEIVSKFQRLIRPQVYQEINWRIRKMLDLKKGELDRGKPFPDVAAAFLEWCGDEPVFCTWGAQDLRELQRNMAYYEMEEMSDKPIRYLNVQKLYGEMIGERERSYALQAAVEKERIIKDVAFHRAYSDAYYTSKILRMIPEDIEKRFVSYDLYHLPANREEELEVHENGHISYISKGYPSRDAILHDPYLMRIHCEECNRREIPPVVDWFVNGSAGHAIGLCPEHGYVAGRLRIRKAELGGYYADRCFQFVEEEVFHKYQEDRKLWLEKKNQQAAE